jgi:hypothetical protein
VLPPRLPVPRGRGRGGRGRGGRGRGSGARGGTGAAAAAPATADDVFGARGAEPRASDTEDEPGGSGSLEETATRHATLELESDMPLLVRAPMA